MRAPNVRLPRELERSAPRDVRLTGNGVALVVLAAVLAIAAAVAGVGFYAEAQRQWNAAREMDRRGVPAPAIVDRLWRKSDDGKPAFASFHFDANGVRVNGQSRMELETWRELRVGGPLRVRYLPDDPGRWVADGARRSRMPFWVSYLAASTLALAAIVCGLVVHNQRALLRDGRAARAIVTAVRKHHAGHGATHTQISYEFSLFGGGQETGKASVSKPPAVGAAVTIVYDPDRPKRSRPYPFSLVTSRQDS